MQKYIFGPPSLPLSLFFKYFFIYFIIYNFYFNVEIIYLLHLFTFN